MVLFKRKPVTFPPTDQLPDNLNVKAWYIEYTKEWFLTYDQYLKRMDYYNTKKFVCEITGNSCLTFFEAYESEQKEMTIVEENFPEHLKEPILRHLQFSTVPRIDQLVDEVYSAFKNDYYPGETVMIRLNDYKNDFKTKCIIREKAKFNAVGGPENSVRPAHCKYRVSRVDTGAEVVVDEHQVTRDRNNFTKWFVKTFIKLSVTRSPKLGAPWMVKQKYADKYRISSDYPPELARFKEESKPMKKRALASQSKDGEKKPRQSQNQDKKSATPTKLQPILPKGASSTGSNLKTENNSTTQTKRVVKEDLLNEVSLVIKKPVPSRIGELGPYVEDALESWAFLNVYHIALTLDTFTFDDFLTALRWDSPQDDCSLLNEIFCGVLSLFLPENGENLEVPYPEELDDDEDEDEQEQEQDEGEGEEEDTNKVDDYLTDKVPWLERLSKRNFKDGSWQIILLGILDGVRTHKKYKDDIKQIFDILAPLESGVSPAIIKKHFYNDLPVRLRIKVLSFLCSFLVDSNLIRLYLEKCMEESAQLRRERFEITREYKSTFEKAQDIDKLCRESMGSPNGTSNNGIITQSNDSSTQDPAENKLKRRRRAGLTIVPSEAELEYAKSNQNFGNLLASRTIQLRQSEQLRKRKNEIEKELAELDVQRIKYIGKDRYYNRYWWFELNGLPNLKTNKASEDDEEEEEEVDFDDDAETSDETYLMGRLWVQGPTSSDVTDKLHIQTELIEEWDQLNQTRKTLTSQNHEKSDSTGTSDSDHIIEITTDPFTNVSKVFKLTFEQGSKQINSTVSGNVIVDEYGKPAFVLSNAEKKVIEEAPALLLSGKDWAYFDEPEEIEELLKWLNAWGQRESKLVKELLDIKDKVISSLKSRKKSLNIDSIQEEEAELRRFIEETVLSDTEVESVSSGSDREEDDDDGEEAGHETETAAEINKKFNDTDETGRTRSSTKAFGHNQDNEQKKNLKEAQTDESKPSDRVAQRKIKRQKIKEHTKKKAQLEEAKLKITDLRVDNEIDHCLDWVNQRAIDKLGHLHYDGPKKVRNPNRKSRK